MKKNFFAFLAAVLMFSASAHAEVDAAAAEAFVKNVTRQGIEQIINANVSQAEKDARFAKLFNDALDLDFIGQFVLGRNWRTATPEQRKEFIKVYRQLNISTWSKRFDEFKGKDFIFNGTTPSNSKGQIFVNSKVPMDQANRPKLSGAFVKRTAVSKSLTSSLKMSAWQLRLATSTPPLSKTIPVAWTL